MNDQLNNKINNIDELLNNESKLNEYINNMEHSDCYIPPNLEKKLLNQFSNPNTGLIKMDVTKHKPFDITIKIFKIAACTVFAIIVCNISMKKDIPFDKIDEANKKLSNFNSSFNDILFNMNKGMKIPDDNKEE